MARPLHRAEQPELAPNPPFAATSQPQFTPSQYPYPQSTNDYPIDHDLTMTDNYPQNIAPSLRTQLEDASNPVPTNGQLHSINVNVDTAVAPGMAPPQTPQQADFSPTAQRTSMDDTPEAGSAGEGTKRKRSKVSRACDECRRKKVRCDAAADDGSLKTCTNCSKAGLTCEYSRVPMKRGPSKGYIKELSERVHQVESLQMAMSGPSGYRQSMDSNSNAGGYPEPGLSPEETMSLKRHYSFPDARNPFSPAEFQRERMPSVGGWSLTSPIHPGLRPRDQGSLALAPDQQLPPINYPEYSKPFWDDFEEPPAAKRRKVEQRNIEPITFASDQLLNYYQSIHPLFPLLPDADSTIDLLQKTQPTLQHCFTVVLNLFPSFRPKNEVNGQNGNGNLNQSNNLSQTSKVFPNYEDLTQFLWQQASESPSERSREDNIALLWICLLLAVQLDFDLTRVKEGILSRNNLIKQAIDLATFMKTQDNIQEPSLSLPGHRLAIWVRNCWNCACTLAKFHALSIGSGVFVSLQEYAVQTESLGSIPNEAAFLARISNIVALILPMIQDGNDAQSTFYIMSKKLTLRQHLGDCIAQTPGLNADSRIVREVRLFFELLLARYTSITNPIDVLQPAVDLADVLSSSPIASTSGVSGTASPTNGELIYNPLHLHMFVLTTITLLEFLVDLPNPELCKLAEETLNNKIQPVLEQKAENIHSMSTKTDPSFWQSVNTSTAETTQNRILTNNQNAVGGAGAKRSHWSDYLLAMINDRRKIGWAINTTINTTNNPGNTSTSNTTSITSAPTSAGLGERSILASVTSATSAPSGVNMTGPGQTDPRVILLDFSRLLKRGYLNVLVR